MIHKINNTIDNRNKNINDTQEKRFYFYCPLCCLSCGPLMFLFLLSIVLFILWIIDVLFLLSIVLFILWIIDVFISIVHCIVYLVDHWCFYFYCPLWCLSCGWLMFLFLLSIINHKINKTMDNRNKNINDPQDKQHNRQ
jgi:hypothetical protein